MEFFVDDETVGLRNEKNRGGANVPLLADVKMEREIYIYISRAGERQSAETLTGFIPGISRGNGGLILCRKFLTSRTFGAWGREGEEEERLKYYPRDGFPMPGLDDVVRRGGETAEYRGGDRAP